MEGIRWAEGAVAGEVAAQRPPVLFALPTQPASDPRPDLISTLQQEVHQLHVRPGRKWTHQAYRNAFGCFVQMDIWMLKSC